MKISCPYCGSNDTTAGFTDYDPINKNIIWGELKCNFCKDTFTVEKDYENKTIKINNHFLGWSVK